MVRLGKRKTKPQQTSPPPPVVAVAPSQDTAVPAELPPRAAPTLVRVRRSSVAPRVTCGLCGGILRDATTVSECLHSFCRKCIYRKFEDEDINYCPTCNTHLGCAPLAKLRSDHSLQCISSLMFPAKKHKVGGILSLHPASISLSSSSPETDVEVHPAKKTYAYLMGEPMNTEIETEPDEKLGMEHSASLTKLSRLPATASIIQGGNEVEEQEIAPDHPVLATSEKRDTKKLTPISEEIFAFLNCNSNYYRASTPLTLPPMTPTRSAPPASKIKRIETTLASVPSSETLNMEVEVEVVKETPSPATPPQQQPASNAPTEVDVLRVQGPQGQEQTFNEPAERQFWGALQQNQSQAVQALETAFRLIQAMGAPTQELAKMSRAKSNCIRFQERERVRLDEEAQAVVEQTTQIMREADLAKKAQTEAEGRAAAAEKARKEVEARMAEILQRAEAAEKRAEKAEADAAKAREAANAERELRQASAELVSQLTTRVSALEKEVDALKADLEAARGENTRLDQLRIGTELLVDELQVPQPAGTTTLEARLLSISNRFGTLRRESFEAGVFWTLVMEQTHYGDSLNLQGLSLGMVPGFTDEEVEAMKEKATPVAATLAELLASFAFPLSSPPRDE